MRATRSAIVLAVIGVLLLAAAAVVRFAVVPAVSKLPTDLDILAGACPVVASYGGRDRMLAGAADTLERTLTRHDVPHDVREYPGAGHSFLNDRQNAPLPMRPMARLMGVGPEPESAQDAWRRIDAFFDTHLRSAA